jgi:uncharacterized membrane protein YgcG
MSSKVRVAFWASVLVIAGLLAAGFAPNAIAGSHVAQALSATSHAPGAHGRAKLALKTASKGRFRVVARKLAPETSFDLVVGGVKVGSFTTNAAGSGKVMLSTHPKPPEGFLGVDPRGKTIEVRDDSGDDDLEGDMPGDDDSAAGAFACCVPDDDGAECEVKTPDKCAAAGGMTQAGITSCIPNPCATTPPGGGEDVVCCFPGSSTGAFVDEESETGCDEVTTQECAMGGGTVVHATSCDSNPCAPVPPPQVTVCCVPDGSETECEILTADHCSAAHGTPNAAKSCESNPCGGVSGGGGDDSGGNGDDSGRSGGDGGDGSADSGSGDHGSSDG